MATAPANGLWAKLAAALASIVSIGFFTWAAVVYNGWQDVRSMLFDVSQQIATLQVTVEHMEREFSYLRKSLDDHSEAPWHDQAGNSISTLRLEMDNVREELRRYRLGDHTHDEKSSYGGNF